MPVGTISLCVEGRKAIYPCPRRDLRGWSDTVLLPTFPSHRLSPYKSPPSEYLALACQCLALSEYHPSSVESSIQVAKSTYRYMYCAPWFFPCARFAKIVCRRETYQHCSLRSGSLQFWIADFKLCAEEVGVLKGINRHEMTAESMVIPGAIYGHTTITTFRIASSRALLTLFHIYPPTMFSLPRERSA